MNRRSASRQQLLMQALTSVGGFVSAQELYFRLHDDGHPISLSTVYRGLHALADDRMTEQRVADEGETVYRIRSRPDDHVIACRRCGRSAALEAVLASRLARQAAEAHGFTDIEVDLRISGICTDCAARQRIRAAGGTRRTP